MFGIHMKLMWTHRCAHLDPKHKHIWSPSHFRSCNENKIELSQVVRLNVKTYKETKFGFLWL